MSLTVIRSVRRSVAVLKSMGSRAREVLVGAGALVHAGVSPGARRDTEGDQQGRIKRAKYRLLTPRTLLPRGASRVNGGAFKGGLYG